MANLVLLNNGVIGANPYGITQFTGATQSTDHIGKTLSYGSSQTGTQDVTCTTNGSIDWSKYSQVIITYAMNFENRSGFTGDANGYVYIGSTAIVSRNRTQSTGGYITDTIDVTSFNATETMSFRAYLRKTNTFGVGASSDVNIKTIELVPNLEVTTSVSPLGTGSVTGGGFYPSGSSVTLTATPNPNYEFSYFDINGVIQTSNPYTFTISSDTNVVAYFSSLGHDVNLVVNPLGYGSVTGDGSYPEGASVTIEATPNTHKVFVNWTENGVEISTSPSYTFTMGGADVTYTANFTDAQIFTIETSTSPSTMPSVYQSAYQVYEGESVTLRAREMSGYVFTGWSDGTTANPYLLIPTGNLVITANYIPVPTSTDANSFRAYIKSQTDVNGLPIAFIDVRSFTIRRDLLTSATSDFNVLNVPTDVSNGDILVLYDSKGKVLYQGIIISIEDGNIQCSQIQSFYRGLWIYDTDPQSDLEGEIASLLGDFAMGKLKGSTYTDSLVATEKSGLTISTNSSTALSLPSGEGDMDMETFIYSLYKTYGMIFDINIAYESGGYTIISIPNYTPIKIGNNSEQVLNLSPVTEVAETNKLVVFASNGTYRSTFVYTSTNGIVEEPVTDVGRYGVINTKVVRTDDPITDVVASELPSVMYNHHLTFDLLMDGNLYNFDDLKLGQPIQVWNGTDYYSTIFTGYEMSCGENERPTSVHIVCGNVRLALTQKLLMGVIK